jgi:hypothetical protein
MKIFIILFFSIFAMTTSALSQSEDIWTVKRNGKVIYTGRAGEEITIPVKAKKLPQSTKYTFTYKTADADNTWNRTIYINNEQDHVVKKFVLPNQSGSIFIKAADINPLLAKKQTLSIYTASLPKDKAQAATVRVRRVMLGKIDLN